ncbi:zinc finger protein 726-like [Chrysoperla carnea]|uniref:zinc finger protein 726-like n=1 Tax=Chrysoperla carnea TaxID=189513 RepID=UPI001D06B781|nr:zinc finger protein 726-like [Chrysoperla carnea]
METILVTDFEKVCRICMEFDKTFLSINSFKIIDMIMACVSVQIWENDDLPNQICHACFLQLQNTINFKQLCENSDKAFRQIIQRNNINLSNNQNNLNGVKDEEFEDYVDDNSPIDIKEEEDIHENIKIENILENERLDEVNNCTLELNKVPTKTEEENNDTKDKKNVIETFTCEKCKKDFDKAHGLGYHMFRKHRAKAIKCSECKLKCYHPLHLRHHQEVAHNPLNRTCDICNKILGNIYELQRHKFRHSSFKSEMCEKTKQEGKCHIKKIHKREEKYITCHICGKLIRKTSLKSHLSTHEERDKVSCDICSKTFVLEATLAKHIKQVHENKPSDRKHLCNICGYSSCRSTDLRKHMISHSSERPYVCEHCNKSYKYPFDLKDHISKVHLNQRKFQCTFCSQAFFEKRHLVHHERRHTGEKPHKCEVCGKRFIQKIALQIHMKTHTSSSENLMQR